jgi:retinol-binding protein 3
MTCTLLYRSLALLLLGVGYGWAQTTVPDTPAGHTLQEWLAAFNSGDRAKIETYVKTVDHSESVDGMLSFHNQTGGFDLLSVESSEPLHIRFRVKEKGGPTTALGNLFVKDGQPPTVATFALRALPPGVALANLTLDAALRKQVIDGIGADLTEFYIDAPLATQMKEALQAHEKAGAYDTITDGDVFAERLTTDLQAVSHDKHLRVNFNP